jgi:hypothetical protein
MEMETRSRAIDKVYKRRARIEMPDFQREEVWPDDKKRLLIDNILRVMAPSEVLFSQTRRGHVRVCRWPATPDRDFLLFFR